jgi:RsiW-degrading membrane proteinase PrsW (M82 family)
MIAPAASIAVLSHLGEALVETGPSKALLFVGIMGGAPVVEELAKAIGVLLVVLLTSEFDNPTDGVVYGTASGLGFAVAENLLYGISAVGSGVYQGLAIVMMVGGRTVLTAGVHAVSSAAFGGFLGHALLARRRRSGVAWVMVGLLAAISLHAAWNLALHFFGAAGKGGEPRGWLVVIPLLYATYLLVLAAFLRSEHRILKNALAEEVALGVAPPWVAEIIPYYRRRVKAEWWPSRRERTVISRLLTKLAFRKKRFADLPQEKAAVAALEIVKLRQRVREIFSPVGDSEDCR